MPSEKNVFLFDPAIDILGTINISNNVLILIFNFFTGTLVDLIIFDAVIQNYKIK